MIPWVSSFGVKFLLWPERASAASRAINVDNFGAVGDGIANDRGALTRALAAWQIQGGRLEFTPGKTYWLGSVDRESDMFLIPQLPPGAALIGNGATLVVGVSGLKTRLFLFRFHLFEGLLIEGLNIQGIGGDSRINWQGTYFCTLDGALPGRALNFSLRNVEVRDCVAMLYVGGGIIRVSGITIHSCSAIRCYYGLVFHENGDEVEAAFSAIDCRRAYFPYGVNYHRVSIDVAHGSTFPGANACILIKRYTLDTRDIVVTANFKGPEFPWKSAVKLELQNDASAAIEGVTIDAVVCDPPRQLAMAALSFSDLSSEGVPYRGREKHEFSGIAFSCRGFPTSSLLVENETPQCAQATVTVDPAQIREGRVGPAVNLVAMSARSG